MVAVVVIVVAAVVVFAIAAAVIGREARRLDALPPRVIADLDEAVELVAEALPFEVTAHLSYDELEHLLRLHLNELYAQGLRPGTELDAAQDPNRLTVLDEEATVDGLVARAEAAGLEVRPEDVAAVVAAHFAYLRRIGAIGPPAGDAEL